GVCQVCRRKIGAAEAGAAEIRVGHAHQDGLGAVEIRAVEVVRLDACVGEVGAGKVAARAVDDRRVDAGDRGGVIGGGGQGARSQDHQKCGGEGGQSGHGVPKKSVV